MKLKTFVASDPQEALAQVRRELGPEAVILSTQSRHFSHPGSKWPGQRQVEVTAAVTPRVSLDSLPDYRAWGLGEEEPPTRRLREEIQDLKALLRQLLGEQGPPPWLTPCEDLTLLYQNMVRGGIHEQIVRRWLERVRGLVAADKDEPRKNLWEVGLHQLAQEIMVIDPWKSLSKGSCRWTFLGPTGVGKTTTVAKLAIQAAFLKKKRVGLISVDPGRPGSQDQLALYARISELPFYAVQNQSELKAALAKLESLDLVLIDTPGRSPRDPALPQELSQTFGGLKGLEHHVVLSATSTETYLADALEAFSMEPLGSCIVTKIDEVRNLVGVFNQVVTRRYPISFVGTGQKIPGDLELASRRRLAGLLFQSRCS